MKKTSRKLRALTFRPDPDNEVNLQLAADSDPEFNASRYVNEALRLYGDKVLEALAEEKKKQADVLLNHLASKNKGAGKR